jgi:hypothetical protein
MTGLSAPSKKRMRLRTACSAPVERYLVESPLSLWESKKFVRDEGNKDWVVGDDDLRLVLRLRIESTIKVRVGFHVANHASDRHALVASGTPQAAARTTHNVGPFLPMSCIL